MKVYEIMTHQVITARPDMSIREAAELMATHGVSGLPVVDERGAVVGILSEGDLILRQKPRVARPWWRGFFQNGERMAREYQKAMGTTVGEVMTRAVVCVSPDLPIESAALILAERQIRRLPVVSEGRLVGIVSRGDLVKALARAPAPGAGAATDAELVAEMRRRMAAEPWASRYGVVVQAEGGILRLWGLTDTEAEKAALETMARAIPGVTGVDSHLVVRREVPYLYWV
jgi:CBS domain-containing protein